MAKSGIDYSKIKIPTPSGEVSLEQLIEKEVQERLAKIKARAGALAGLRNYACGLFIKKLYEKGGMAKTKTELRKIAQEVSQEITKQRGKKFGFTVSLLFKRGYIGKVEKKIEKEGKAILVRFYTYTPEAIKQFLTPAEIEKAKTAEVSPEEIEKIVSET